jgi:predicted amidohydrolase YtcJ
MTIDRAVSRILASAAALLATGSVAAVTTRAADAIYVNAHVYTPSGWREALAVRDGSILAVDSNAKVRALAAKTTRIEDLHGRTISPGLFDMHVHPMMAGNGAEGVCRIEQGADAERLLRVVADCVKGAKAGDWVTGGQWQAVSMGSTPITKETLDKVSPDNPVVLFDISGHSTWVNSRALALAGIARDTANPEGGIIERGANGEPTGVLRETARDMVLRLVPKPGAEANAAALKGSLDLLLSKGVTGLTDAMVLRDELVAYDTLSDRGELHQAVQACMAYSVAGKREPEFDELIAARKSFARANFDPACVKVFMDGVPTESHTAAMLAPYEDEQTNAPERGLLLVDQKELNAAVARWDKAGITVVYHAAGDAAVRSALDSIEFARKANGMGGPHHQVGHCTFISPEDIPRARQLDAAFEFSPYLWYLQPINEDIIKAVGPSRIERVWPLREGVEAGGIIVAGSDWAVVPDPDPWLAIETSITRKAPGGAGGTFGAAEALTLEQAVKVFTINAARRMRREDRLGSLEAGKQADFIVIDRDPFAIPVTQLHSIRVQRTYIRGEKVFEREGG